MGKKDDVMVFFDGANLYHAQKHYAGSKGLKIYRLDYKKLLQRIVGDRDLIRATYYGSRKVPEDPEQTEFFNVLRSYDIIVKTLELKKRYDSISKRDREFEKGVDVALVTDMLNFTFKGKIGTAILVSGDSDYTSAINILTNEGVNVEVVAFKCTLGAEWRQNPVKLVFIDDFANEVRLYSE